MSEVFDKATEKAEEGLAGLGERLYSEYEKLPWYKQLLLAIAPVTGETISAYETPIFAEKTKEAYKKGDYLETAGHGALTGLSVLGAIPFLGAGIRGVKAGVKGARKGLSGLSFGPKGEPSKLSPEALKAFENVSGTQRGAPEIAMSKIQSSQTAPELSGVVEHIGDLTHVLTNEAPYGSFRRDRVRSKIAGQLRVLENPNLEHFIEEGHKSLSTFNKAEKGISESVDTIRKRYHKLMQKYADEHRKIPVFNRPQKLARDAAVAIGERRFKEAAKLLRNLDKIAEDPTGFQHAASRFRKERARKGLASLDKPLEVSTAGQFTTTIDIPSGSGEIRSIKIPVFNQMYADTPLTPLPNKVIEAKKRATAAETKLQQFLSESIDGVTVHNYNPQQQAAVTRANRAVQKALREAFPKLSTNNEINALTALENGIPGFPMEKLTK